MIVVSGITGSLLVGYPLARGQADGSQCEGDMMLRAERRVMPALAGSAMQRAFGSRSSR
jgi:hypothetical protein